MFERDIAQFDAMATNSSSAADNQFGPAIRGFRGNFDFTLLFEDAFLALVPSSILLMLMPFRTVWLWGSSKKVTESIARLNKIVGLKDDWVDADPANKFRLFLRASLFCSSPCCCYGPPIIPGVRPYRSRHLPLILLQHAVFASYPCSSTPEQCDLHH